MVTPMMRLQDPEQTKILIVTLPETTPVLEAAQLQDDLRRAGIEPWGWIVNASLAAADRRTIPLLRQRAAAEWPTLPKSVANSRARSAVVAMTADDPVGARETEGALRHTKNRTSRLNRRKKSPDVHFLNAI